ncbi:MAG: HYR domain-containing protein, partial [Planctomycetes bacterium]|nr:HYR domain-containing protein [Planctomycetota bacterium]
GVSFTLNDLTVAHGGPNSTSRGGGLFDNGGSLIINNSTFADNTAISGAGLLATGGTVSISNSTFLANNSTVLGGGGGILNQGATMSITNSTFANNTTSVHCDGVGGGGILNSGNLTISNSTFVNNSGGCGPQGVGGGLFNSGGSVIISDSTFANNTASGFGPNSGGGIYGVVNISNSIVANNSNGNCAGGVRDSGYNLSSDSSCGFTGTGSLQNTDPKLDPNGLQNNGGPTQTIALQSGSPASDVIPSANCPATDQRGVSRPDNGETTCDMGGYEFVDPVDNDLALTNMPANITTNATSSQGAVVTYTPPTVVDEDSPLPLVNCSPASGSTFAIGTTTVTCTVSDSDDINSPVSQSFMVTVNPVLSVRVANVIASEGSAFSGVVATGSAYGASNPLTATIDWGDGTTSTVSVTPNADGSYSVPGSHTYAEEGSYTLSVSIKDSGSLSATGKGTAQVSDAALSLTHFVAGPLPHRSAGVAATFTDADPAGTISDYTATITWGDGSTSTVKVVKNPVGQGFALAGLHSYAGAGTYSVTLTVTDQGGSQVSKIITIIVK